MDEPKTKAILRANRIHKILLTDFTFSFKEGPPKLKFMLLSEEQEVPEDAQRVPIVWGQMEKPWVELLLVDPTLEQAMEGLVKKITQAAESLFFVGEGGEGYYALLGAKINIADTGGEVHN